MIRRPPRSTLDRSSAASDVYKRQVEDLAAGGGVGGDAEADGERTEQGQQAEGLGQDLSLIHISEPTRPY